MVGGAPPISVPKLKELEDEEENMLTDFPIEQIRRFKESRSRACPDFLKINLRNMHQWVKYSKQSLPSKVDLISNKPKSDGG